MKNWSYLHVTGGVVRTADMHEFDERYIIDFKQWAVHNQVDLPGLVIFRLPGRGDSYQIFVRDDYLK
jgi:hypothetical protein